jgi:hypothetical protein
MLTNKELEQFNQKGISKEKAEWQIKQFIQGVKPIRLVEPATPQKGITLIKDKQKFIDIFESNKGSYTKFVPASGAASRMFKALFEFKDEFLLNHHTQLSLHSEASIFFGQIKNFAFYKELNLQCEAKGASIKKLLEEKKYDIILDNLLNKSGLSYGHLPKGLLTFHKYPQSIVRTAFEEHLTEGALYAKSENNSVHLHFTVSPEHIGDFKTLSNKVLPDFEKRYNVKYTIEYSVQNPATDTLAVTEKNKPFLDDNGTILFRPGGHGALIENLNQIDSDIIFMKNIDNVVPESRLDIIVDYKKILAGKLLEMQSKIFQLIKKLSTLSDINIIKEAKDLLLDDFCLNESCFSNSKTPQETAQNIIDRLNRPIRICGVVKNEGEPGGGPFFTLSENGCKSLQIVESSQVDVSDREQKQILQSSTHFNPVDIVCGVKDYKGNKFDLTKYVDPATCFIAEKSKSGRKLKALELPGLWNGAMAGWNTIFIEVPVETFNPVKVVNDLCRENHQ